ncbi:DUF58 domain-containing protein [Oceanospirillum sanctuarii]|uniref:DUF58 domain-containing protein n=1 Tax=Oceanospirillum sanctuarii TaxID=1434821 RepID=UPI000A3A74BA|nr:DUF58 domain-containing protein [Oceanospirillum sanctuarii]
MLQSAWQQIRKSLQPEHQLQGSAPFLPELRLDQLTLLQEHKNLLGLNLRSPTGSTLAGQHRSRQQGRGMELSEIRNYQPGDDIRLMDWKVTARTRRPHTKVFMEERERPVHLVVDLSASMLFGSDRSKAEQAANTAAILGWALSYQGDRCGGLVFNGHETRLIKPKARHKGLLPLLKSSCDLGQQITDKASRAKPGRMNQVLRQIAAQPGHGSLIVLISDFWSLDLEEASALSQLSRNHNLVAVQISDPLERELPGGSCFLTDGKQDYYYDGTRSEEQERYRKEFDLHQAALKQRVQKARGHFISLSTQEKPADKLKQFFAKGSR